MNNTDSFLDLLNLIDELLGENGCDWDKSQTHESLIPSIIEESYEVVDAVKSNESAYLCEELGDLLFLILLNCKIAEKSGNFNYDDCLRGVRNKMIYRHPHVFLKKSKLLADEVLKNWDELKKKEKGYTDELEILKNIPESLPALFRAYKILKRVVKNDPDYFDNNSLISDFQNCTDTLKSNIVLDNNLDFENLGRLFFILVTFSAKSNINAEFALTNAIETFINKFGSS